MVSTLVSKWYENGFRPSAVCLLQVLVAVLVLQVFGRVGDSLKRSIFLPGALDTHSLTVVLASLGGNALFFQKRPFLPAPSVLVLLCSLRVQHTRNTRNDTKPTKPMKLTKRMKTLEFHEEHEMHERPWTHKPRKPMKHTKMHEVDTGAPDPHETYESSTCIKDPRIPKPTKRTTSDAQHKIFRSARNTRNDRHAQTRPCHEAHKNAPNPQNP